MDLSSITLDPVIVGEFVSYEKRYGIMQDGKFVEFPLIKLIQTLDRKPLSYVYDQLEIADQNRWMDSARNLGNIPGGDSLIKNYVGNYLALLKQLKVNLTKHLVSEFSS